MVTIQTDEVVDLRRILDRSEVAKIPGAEDTLRECMFRSVEIRYGLVDGEIACMWGVIPPTLLSNTAYLWLLTTDIVAEHKFLFVRHSQRYIEAALKEYYQIIGDVVVGNQSAIRWLRWLGAEFGQPFHGRIPFVIRQKQVLNG